MPFFVYSIDISWPHGPMAYQEWTNFLDAALVILGLVDFGFSLQADGGGSLRTHLDGFHGDFLGVKGSLQTKKITLVNHVFFRDVDLWVSVQKKNIHDITIE